MKQEEEQIKWMTKLSKYFAQGILFSVIFIGLSIGWAFLSGFLVSIEYIIGLIIDFLILSYLIGLLNVVLTDEIWNTHTREDLKSLFSQGFFLFITLIFVRIPEFLINLAAPSLATTIALFIVYSFIDGFLSKTIATSYKITDHERDEIPEYLSEALQR